MIAAETAKRRRRLLRGTVGIVTLLAIWEGFAGIGLFSTALTPPLETIAATIWDMTRDGTLPTNALATLTRVFVGFAISFVIAVPLGVLMGRYWVAERFFLPLVSVIVPIPSLAWVPLLLLWCGIGDTATLIVVVYASAFPLLYNVWRGVTAVNPIWLRAARVMGADRWTMFRKVILPGAMPYIITGARLGFGRAWIGVVGAELLSSPQFGLGEIIFNAGEFLQSNVMFSAIIVTGALGVILERFVFQVVEGVTVRKWGMALESGR
jgi:NitT/TauT family transport system permease protein